MRYVKGYEVVLEEGDSLFMPSGYWHYITYLEGSFSVSYRKMALPWKTKLLGLFNLSIMTPVDKLLNRFGGEKWLEKKKQMAQNRANRILSQEALPEFNSLSRI